MVITNSSLTGTQYGARSSVSSITTTSTTTTVARSRGRGRGIMPRPPIGGPGSVATPPPAPASGRRDEPTLLSSPPLWI
jgi:hypothetical protein